NGYAAERHSDRSVQGMGPAVSRNDAVWKLYATGVVQLLVVGSHVEPRHAGCLQTSNEHVWRAVSQWPVMQALAPLQSVSLVQPPASWVPPSTGAAPSTGGAGASPVSAGASGGGGVAASATTPIFDSSRPSEHAANEAPSATAAAAAP